MICEGRVVVVTGAGRGIGRAHALALAAAGARVVVNDVGASGSGEGTSTAPAHEVVTQIEDAGGKGFMGEMEGDTVFYELKFFDPNGTIFDITHNGWGGARKDGPAPKDN